MTQVVEIMTTPVKTVPPDLDTAAARHLMRKARVHHLVVMEGDRIVGILSQRDLGGTCEESLPAGRIDAVMRTDVVAIPPGATVRAAAAMLRGYDIGCLPVVDGKTLVGILTTSDLLDWISAAPGRRAAARRPRGRARRGAGARGRAACRRPAARR
ncbi:MAG: CBS domain-containing protein [Myxococcales bacterium]|nr:CBS domain-containing protein [Myxococcales bacterium]